MNNPKINNSIHNSIKINKYLGINLITKYKIVVCQKTDYDIK